MTAMKENVATRTAAHDRMKTMWLSVVKTLGGKSNQFPFIVEKKGRDLKQLS